MRKYHVLLAVGILLGLFNGCAYYNTFYNAKQFYNDAAKERKKRERTQVVELSPEEKELARRQGNLADGSAANKPSATEMQNYQKAIEKASSVLEYFPKSRWVDDALIMVGECFFYRQEYSKAQRKFEEIINLYPNSEFIPEAEILLGKTFLALREFDTAEKKFREIALNKRFPKQIRQSAEYELGSLYFEKDNFEAAAEVFTRTAKESDDRLTRAMSLYRLGECHVQLKAYNEAVPVFRRAIQASPNEDFKSQASYKLGESQILLKEYDAAIRTFSMLLAKELEVKRIPMIKLQLANSYRYKGEEESAVKWYRNIIEEHKGTEASARSYFSLAEIEEYNRGDYTKAKENYDLVRGEQSASLIATTAKQRSDNIKQMLELQQSINELLGIATARDSSSADGGKSAKKEDLDDAPIDLGAEGMWMNYAGRGRRPPRNYEGVDPAELLGAGNALTEDTSADSSRKEEAVPDSLRQLMAKEAAEKKKSVTLAEKRLELAELLMFSFNHPDSSMKLFLQVVESKPDSAMTARALYSIGYIMYAIKKDTVQADSLFRGLVYLYPGSPHAEGARRILGWPLLSDKVDTAGIVYRDAERAYWEEKNLSKALKLYNSIVARYPLSPYAIKAEYGKGWLYEHEMQNYDKALETFKGIVEKYPESAYGKNLKNKLNRHEQAIRAIEERKKAIADSIKLAAEKARSASDSLRLAAAVDSTAAGREASQTANAAPDSAAARAAAPADTAAAGLQQPAAGGTSQVDEADLLRESQAEKKLESRSVLPREGEPPGQNAPDARKTEKNKPVPQE
jgi:TolA-binding protein